MELSEAVTALAAQAGDLDSARAALDALLRRRIGYDVAAFSTTDPATGLWTSCYVSGLDAAGSRERERVLFDLEFAGTDVNPYIRLAAGDSPVATLHRATNGDVTRALRWPALLSGFGVVDEMRVALRSAGQLWGTLTLYRTGDAGPFQAEQITAVSSAAPAIATFFRLMLLRLAVQQPHSLEHPPGAFLVAPDGSIHSVSATAQAWLDLLDDRGRLPSVISSVSASARHAGLAVAAVPSRMGGFVTLHASAVQDSGSVTIIIEAARPAVVSDVIAQAHGLTAREREITSLAALGNTTREMARQLSISPFTVADHLKSIFAKVSVASRAELVAALYHQHYEPRSREGAIPAPYGWYLDANLACRS